MKKYLMINTDSMGQGDEELGRTLMKMFLGTTIASGYAPEGIALMNSGVKLTCTGSNVLDELKELEARGTHISSCITCLKKFGLLDKVQVGIQGTMSLYVQYAFESDDTFVIG